MTIHHEKIGTEIWKGLTQIGFCCEGNTLRLAGGDTTRHFLSDYLKSFLSFYDTSTLDKIPLDEVL